MFELTGEGFRFMDLPDVVRMRVFEILLVEHDKDPLDKRRPGVVRVMELDYAYFQKNWRRTYFLPAPASIENSPGRDNNCEHHALAVQQANTYGSDRSYSAQVLRVCRAWYRDAAPVFYSQNLFHFQTARAFIPFLIDRGHRSRQFLAAISLPFPDEQRLEDGRRVMLGRGFDWKGFPAHYHDVVVSSVWRWLVDSFFNKPVGNLPALEILDLRVTPKRLTPPHPNPPARYRWDEPLGSVLASFGKLHPLNLLDNLATVRLSSKTVLATVRRRGRAHWIAAPDSLGARLLPDERDLAYNESPEHPGHVSRTELEACERNYALVYALAPEQQRTMARRSLVYPREEYDAHARHTGRLTVGEIERLAVKVRTHCGWISEIESAVAAASPQEAKAATEVYKRLLQARGRARRLRQVLGMAAVPGAEHLPVEDPPSESAEGENSSDDAMGAGSYVNAGSSTSGTSTSSAVVHLSAEEAFDHLLRWSIITKDDQPFLVPLTQQHERRIRRMGTEYPKESRSRRAAEPDL